MVESSDIYFGIDILLKDLYEFIESIIIKLPSTFQDEAKKLIQRTKKQIDVIKPNTDPYIQMKGKSNTVTTDEYVETDFVKINKEDSIQANYDIPENQLVYSLKPGEVCPYDDLPLFELIKKASKEGPLWRNEKILFIEQVKKYYAIQIENWLLIYNHTPNEKHSKPYNSINTADYSLYSGKNTQIKQYDKRIRSFELTELNGKKSYQFIARSPKEMEQWVTIIKNASDNRNNQTTLTNFKKSHTQEVRSLPPPPPPPSQKEEVDDYEKYKSNEHIEENNDDETYQEVGTNISNSELDIYDEVGTALKPNNEQEEELTYDDIDNVKKEIATKYYNVHLIYDEPNNTNQKETSNFKTQNANNPHERETTEQKKFFPFLLGKNIPPPVVKPQVLKNEQNVNKMNQSHSDFNNSAFLRKSTSKTKKLIQLESFQINNSKKFSPNQQKSDVDVEEYYDSVNVYEPPREEEKSKFSTFLSST